MYEVFIERVLCFCFKWRVLLNKSLAHVTICLVTCVPHQTWDVGDVTPRRCVVVCYDANKSMTLISEIYFILISVIFVLSRFSLYSDSQKM